MSLTCWRHCSTTVRCIKPVQRLSRSRLSAAHTSWLISCSGAVVVYCSVKDILRRLAGAWRPEARAHSSACTLSYKIWQCDKTRRPINWLNFDDSLPKLDLSRLIFFRKWEWLRYPQSADCLCCAQLREIRNLSSPALKPTVTYHRFYENIPFQNPDQWSHHADLVGPWSTLWASDQVDLLSSHQHQADSVYWRPRRRCPLAP